MLKRWFDKSAHASLKTGKWALEFSWVRWTFKQQGAINLVRFVATRPSDAAELVKWTGLRRETVEQLQKHATPTCNSCNAIASKLQLVACTSEPRRVEFQMHYVRTALATVCT